MIGPHQVFDPAQGADRRVRRHRKASPVGDTHVRRWRRVGILLLLLVVLLGIGRAVLPGTVRSYANRLLQRSPLYAGKIGDVEIHLLRGAYAVKDVEISKTAGNVPVPFFAAKRV